MSDLLLGIDVGTTACKAAVVDARGAERAHGQAPTPWRRVPTGAEVDCEVLFRAALAAARMALAAAPRGRVRAIGVTSMAEAGALLDRDGRVLHPAVAWHDARGAEEARRMAADLGEERFRETTGLPASALCTLAKLRWLADHRPATRAARRWLNLAEWVVHRLGGRHVGELSLASRTGLLDLAARAPWEEALAWAGLRGDLLPEPLLAGTPGGTVVPHVLPEAEGAVLAVAGHDHLCAGIGAGVVAPGDTLDSCGTAEAVVRVVTPLAREQVGRSVAGGVTVGWHVAEGRQALLGAALSGLVLQEVLDALGVGPDRRAQLDAGALATAPGEAPPLELHLQSLERPPLSLPRDVAPERLWRGAIEAVTTEIAAILGQIEAIAGPPRKIVVAGGWARDPVVLESKRRLGAIETPPVVEAGARGAALLAGVAAGLYAGADEVPPVAVGSRHRCPPLSALSHVVEERARGDRAGMNPVVLPPNGVPRFYRGGPAIAALRGERFAGERVPEEWVGSTTTVFGDEALGLSRLPGGALLRDVLAADPQPYLGPSHVQRFGADPALLVKLLDAGERLPVHVHPDGGFARRHLGTAYGKTEAWIVVAVSRPAAAVHVGFRQDVDPRTLERWVRDQDHDAMLGALNPVPVKPGDAIFVPAGVPHSIGEGLLIVELQEPTDLSILLEWDGFGIADEQEATLGLGWGRALDCVARARVEPGPLRGPDPSGPVSSLLPAEADAFFRAQRIAPARVAELEQGFAIVIVIDGAGQLYAEDGGPLELRRGGVVLVPWAAGAWRVEGDVVAIACRPPAIREEEVT